jgi:hypothetical protein
MLAALGLTQALCACQRVVAAPEPRGEPASPPARHTAPAPRPAQPLRIVQTARVIIEAGGLTGLSDLTTDGAGRLWAIAEHTRALVRMKADGSAPVVVALVGVPDGLDVEGLAWLEGDRLVMATESDDPRRDSDLLLFARVKGPGRVEVESTVALDYRLWPIAPRGNQGIEGLCRAGRALVAAVETVLGTGDRRLAPIATYDLDRGRWAPYLVRLTTSTGKLSALSCRARAGAIDVVAIERHFEVARLIRFEVPAPAAREAAKPAAPAEIAPVLVADLAPLLVRQENFEGLVWDGDRAIALVVDNDWAGVNGPNLLVRARLSGPAPSPPPASAPPPPWEPVPTPRPLPAPPSGSPPARPPPPR